MFRQQICDDFWVRIGKRRIQKLLDAGSNIVISDTRFPNEADAIKSLGGITVVVEKIRIDGKEPPMDLHPSEIALDDYSFDYRILAVKGDIPSLKRQIDDIIGR